MFVYGRNSIEEAITEEIKMTQVLVAKGKEGKYSNLLKRIAEQGIPIKSMLEDAIEKLAKSRKTQGIAAELALPKNIVETDGDDTDWSQYRKILALDGITDTGNLGAIVRSALLLGADAIVLPNDNSARITPAAIKASAGAVYRQTIVYLDSLNKFIDRMTELEFSVFGLAGESKKTICDVELRAKVCIVIGSEREGIRKSVKRKCEDLLSIPTTRKLDSLNASVASAIAMWQLFGAGK